MGLVFNIQRLSIHDGPGIRTTIFFQGCNMRCFWCQDPESKPLTPQVEFIKEKCVLCGRCIEICPQGAQGIVDNRRTYDRSLCKNCGLCVAECAGHAMMQRAREMTINEVMAKIRPDRDYFEDSGGGVTFSGGEPFLQKDFLVDLLRVCKRSGLHTTIDTAGNIPYEWIEEVLPFTDLFLYQVKNLDDDRHLAATGVSNQRLLENLRRLAQGTVPIWARVPVVPGWNDTPEEIEAIGQFLAELPAVKQVDLLPFHQVEARWDDLSNEYLSRRSKALTDEKLSELVEGIRRFGLAAQRVA